MPRGPLFLTVVTSRKEPTQEFPPGVHALLNDGSLEVEVKELGPDQLRLNFFRYSGNPKLVVADEKRKLTDWGVVIP